MNKKKALLIIIFLAVILPLLTACDRSIHNYSKAKEVSGISGSWAYIHAKEEAVAVFYDDGKAQYKGKDYSYEYDSRFIELTDGNGETIQLRYELDNEGMYLYSNDTYTYCGEGDPYGLIGEWSCKENNWTYIFTESGTFLEDGYFPGYYFVDNENSTIKLTYNDQFEDTICYFHMEDNKLYMEYPWRMVRVNDN